MAREDRFPEDAIQQLATDYRRPAGNLHDKGGTPGVGFNLNTTAVREDDLLHDVESEAQSFTAP